MDVKEDREIVTMADIPARTGLGSGSTFIVALLRALYWHEQGIRNLSPSDLAHAAVHVERDLMNEAVGIQDQYAAAWGNMRHYEIRADGDVKVSIPLRGASDLLAHCLLGFTGFQRDAYGIAADWIARTGANEAALLKMAGMTKAGLAYLKSRRWAEFGALMHEAWLMKRELSPLIPFPYADAIYGEARGMGAWGGKMLGAGGGGFLLIMAPPEIHPAIWERFKNRLMFVPVKAAPLGAEILFRNEE